ncbi:MAG: hypothetical protein H7246_12450 [Phycisphaerae bacterium]|nr:hypothetical protein [Saprospiraceae bacterium]
MSENTSILPKTIEKSIPPVIYAVISNALQVYGILVLGWHFFPILYMWWWEELVLSTFGVLKLRRLRLFLLQKQSEPEVREGESSARGRFFLLFVYFVFVVVMAGFMFAPRESYIENIITLVFRNNVFNLNLLLFIGMQAWIYWRDFYQNQNFETTDVGELRTTFDLRSSVIHVGLLAGAVVSFLLQKYGLYKTEHAFMFGFMAVKTLVELWAALRRKQ